MRSEEDGGGMDSESRMRLRSIDVLLLKIFEEMGGSSNAQVNALRQDLAGLTTALQDLSRAVAAPPAEGATAQSVPRRPAGGE